LKNEEEPSLKEERHWQPFLGLVDIEDPQMLCMGQSEQKVTVREKSANEGEREKLNRCVNAVAGKIITKAG